LGFTASALIVKSKISLRGLRVSFAGSAESDWSVQTLLHLEWSGLGGVDAGPFFQALVFAAGSVGKSVFFFFFRILRGF
jgi:hypothetical protein